MQDIYNGKMYTVVIKQYGKNRTMQTYSTSLDDAIKKVCRAGYRVDKIKTKEMQQC